MNIQIYTILFNKKENFVLGLKKNKDTEDPASYRSTGI